MTIIAYRDGVMAADTAISDDKLTYGHSRKIFKAKDGSLVGAAGDNAPCEAFIKWALGSRKGKLPKDVFGDKDKISLEGLLVTPDGKISYFDGPFPTVLENEYACVGAGYQVGLGVMWKGGTAQEAVQAAISCVFSCGGRVDLLRLGKSK